jgi:phospholipid/cholesterol/gamma-HCH transport system substrate-binding protein
MTGALLAISICVAIFVLVAKLQQEGFLGKKEYNLYCDLASAQGLHKGTIVQINGVDIGRVQNISLTDAGLVRLNLILDAQYKHWITDKSVVYATRDQNIISERVINIDISKEGQRILEEDDFLIAGTAQDIETVLKTANELIDRLGKLVVVADTILNMIIDTNSSVGALLGSRILYNRLDFAVVRLNDFLVGANGLMAGVNGVVKTINDGMPKAVAFADTLSSSVMDVMGSLDNLTGRALGLMSALDTTISNVGGMVNELSSLTGAAGNVITDGSQTINKADDFVSGVSKFWFLRSKIPQKDSIPLLGGDTW